MAKSADIATCHWQACEDCTNYTPEGDCVVELSTGKVNLDVSEHETEIICLDFEKEEVEP